MDNDEIRVQEKRNMAILIFWMFLIVWCVSLHYFAIVGIISKSEPTNVNSPNGSDGIHSVADVVNPSESLFYTHIFRVTAYCPCAKCCGKFADNVTASGYIIYDGDRFIAAPPEYDFGTVMLIPGYNESKPVPVRDRGGVIKADKLDVYFDTHQEALNWGVQYLEVKILEVEL